MADSLRIPAIGTRPVPTIPQTPGLPNHAKADAGRTISFRETLAEAISEVQRLQNEADTTIKQLVAGDIKDVAEALVAVERADVSFQTMMTVRNRVVSAYEEIMRMQV